MMELIGAVYTLLAVVTLTGLALILVAVLTLIALALLASKTSPEPDFGPVARFNHRPAALRWSVSPGRRKRRSLLRAGRRGSAVTSGAASPAHTSTPASESAPLAAPEGAVAPSEPNPVGSIPIVPARVRRMSAVAWARSVALIRKASSDLSTFLPDGYGEIARKLVGR